jgi:hypothetical protein
MTFVALVYLYHHYFHLYRSWRIQGSCQN